LQWRRGRAKNATNCKNLVQTVEFAECAVGRMAGMGSTRAKVAFRSTFPYAGNKLKNFSINFKKTLKFA
jgi:hypothetical protein